MSMRSRLAVACWLCALLMQATQGFQQLPTRPCSRRSAVVGATPVIAEVMASECRVKGDAATTTVSSLVEELARRTAQVRAAAKDVVPRGAGEASGAEAATWLLRFAAGALGKEVDLQALEASVAASVAWRLGEGRAISDAAREAYAAATAEAGNWNNDPVLAEAPHSAKIAQFFTPAKLLTLQNTAGDGLIYAIRAGQIDDTKLMADVSAAELTDFFLYAKAVNERVVHETAAKTGKLSSVVTCNDLSGVDLFGDTRFRDSLSQASKTGDAIYPGLAAETILLNLPPLVRALVNVFKPLFPKSVQAKLKFATFDLQPTDTFLDKTSPTRAAFQREVDAILAAA